MKEYRNFSTLLIVALLFVMPLLFAPTITYDLGMREENNNIIQLDTDFQTTDTDTSRVEWQLNQYDNEGFERWNDPHSPSDISNYRTTEHFVGFSTTNYSEGSRSLVMQAKAIDSSHPTTAELKPSAWSYSPTSWSNLTVSFDWIVESLPVKTDGDYYRLSIELGNPGTHYLTYYLGCDVTGYTNSSFYHYYMIKAASSGWNTFSRNITADFEDMTTGLIPTEFEYISYQLRSISSGYSRIFMDDLKVVNGTNIVISGGTNNGNFESSSYWYRSSTDPADISQSTDRVEGDYSLNATTLSNGNQSTLSFTSSPDKRLSALNVDAFHFQWKVDDFSLATDETYAYVSVNCKNDTDEFYIYYPLLYGGYQFPLTYVGYNYINATGFNTTGQWNQFDRSIWEDITSFNSTSFLIVEEIQIELRAREVGARISILFDDISFNCAALNDLGYEDQGDIGSGAYAWDASYAPYAEYTVTDEAYRGTKAGNFTVADSNSFSAGQDVGYIPITNETDLWLDLWWQLDDYSGATYDFAYLEVSVDNSDHFAYIFGNGSDVGSGNGFEHSIILPENGTVGTWFNLQRNLHDDYVALYGHEPSTMIYQFYIDVEADSGSRVSLLLDDAYVYIDPEPGVQNLYEAPSSVEANQEVEVTVDIIDASLDTVTLHYSVDSGPWIRVNMLEKSGNIYNASIPGQEYLSQVEYYVSANDTFGNMVDSAADLSLIYGFDVVDTIDPTVEITNPAHDDTVGGSVTITVAASDSGSDISYVEILIEEVLVANLTAAPYSITWDTTTLANGTYSITAIAYDAAGNSAQDTNVVLVQNSATPTTSTTPTIPVGLDATWLIVVAVVATAMVVILVIIFLKRKT
ncbi:MAG: Ig-like domain-containing protein [Candidatus Thorarchaeota archaeon]